MITNHWGITVDSEIPITGVQGFGSLPEGFWDESLNGISLNCVNCPLIQDDLGGCEFCENQGDMLIGVWKKDDQGLFEPDKTGQFSAIIREDVVQIVYSVKTQRAALCSPCYPGQADLDTPGQYLAYCLPWESA